MYFGSKTSIFLRVHPSNFVPQSFNICSLVSKDEKNTNVKSFISCTVFVSGKGSKRSFEAPSNSVNANTKTVRHYRPQLSAESTKTLFTLNMSTSERETLIWELVWIRGFTTRSVSSADCNATPVCNRVFSNFKNSL